MALSCRYKRLGTPPHPPTFLPSVVSSSPPALRRLSQENNDEDSEEDDPSDFTEEDEEDEEEKEEEEEEKTEEKRKGERRRRKQRKSSEVTTRRRAHPPPQMAETRQIGDGGGGHRSRRRRITSRRSRSSTRTTPRARCGLRMRRICPHLPPLRPWQCLPQSPSQRRFSQQLPTPAGWSQRGASHSGPRTRSGRRATLKAKLGTPPPSPLAVRISPKPSILSIKPLQFCK